MTFYVIRRVAIGILLLFFMSAMFFTLTRLTPGQPVSVGENPRIHQEQVNLRLHRLGDSVELKVRDNGRGPSGNGKGGVHLGLTLTKDKVALVGGGAWFEGCEDGGAQVIVRIPVRSTD